MVRLKEREEAFMRIAYREEDGATKKQIDHQRKKEMHENNVKLFGRQTVGVHGCELPQFRTNTDVKEWWKQKGEWVQNPNY